jgi:hypothetical protein
LLNEEQDYLHTQYPDIRVAILVESIEHGRRLQTMLPAWPLLAATGDQRPVHAQTSIVTQTYASQHPIDAHVLVRADGGESPLNIKDFCAPAQQPAQKDNSNALALLIDFKDDFDAHAIDNTEARVRDYQQRGWIK